MLIRRVGPSLAFPRAAVGVPPLRSPLPSGLLIGSGCRPLPEHRLCGSRSASSEASGLPDAERPGDRVECRNAFARIAAHKPRRAANAFQGDGPPACTARERATGLRPGSSPPGHRGTGDAFACTVRSPVFHVKHQDPELPTGAFHVKHRLCGLEPSAHLPRHARSRQSRTRTTGPLNATVVRCIA